MAQIIQTICDFCQPEGVTEIGTPIRINDVVVDVCGRHTDILTLSDVVGYLESGHVAGRPAEDPPLVRRKKGEVNPDGPSCKSCGAGPFKSMQGLRMHFSLQHPDEPRP